MNILKNIFSKKYINKYNKKISYLGPSNKLKLEYFLVTRLLISIFLFIVCLLVPKYGLLLALIISISFYYLYTLILIDNKIKIRSDKLYDEAILLFNMLKLSYNTTKDLKNSLDIVSNKIGNSLALSFRNAIGNHKYNNDLNEIFKAVIDTIPNIDVRKSLLDLKESNYNINTIDNILNELKDKNLIIVKQSNQLKPIGIIVIGVIFLSIIFALLFNINEIVDYLSNLV
jgi:hypothetical protein